jgi:putative ABC transport system permease protein
MKIDGRVFAFALVVSLWSGLVFGIAPALVLSRTLLSEAMKSASPGGGASNTRLRALLAVGEIAIAVTLLAGWSWLEF